MRARVRSLLGLLSRRTLEVGGRVQEDGVLASVPADS